MESVADIKVTVPSDLRELIDRVVASGEYATGSEVVGEALRQWEAGRTLRLGDAYAIQRLWAEGLESGPGHLGTMAAIKHEARRRFETTVANPGS